MTTFDYFPFLITYEKCSVAKVSYARKLSLCCCLQLKCLICGRLCTLQSCCITRIFQRFRVHGARMMKVNSMMPKIYPQQHEKDISLVSIVGADPIIKGFLLKFPKLHNQIPKHWPNFFKFELASFLPIAHPKFFFVVLVS